VRKEEERKDRKRREIKQKGKEGKGVNNNQNKKWRQLQLTNILFSG
jgi:hypothetical protein